MSINVFRYAFGMSVKLLENYSKEYVDYRLGVAEPQYSMLNYLSINELPATIKIIENLERVINGTQIEYDPWGADFCIIASYKEKSVIDHHIDPQTGEWALDPIYKTEIPTAWLLQMMKDWKIFLENNPKEKYM